MATVDINVTGGSGTDTNLGNNDQQIDISGFRNVNYGGNTSSDGLRMRNLALTTHHEFNGVGDYRLIAGRFAMGGGLTSPNYGAILNKTGSAANVVATTNVINSRCFVGLKTNTGNQNVLLTNTASSGLSECITLVGTGTAITKTGMSVDVTGATNNVAINVKNGLVTMNLPTSSAGLPANTLWNDSGTLKIA